MRFPPKSYNKDLESAEVRSHPARGSPAATEATGELRLPAPGCRQPPPLPSRSAGSASSRTWSSQRRWQRTMTTVFRDPLAWLYFFYLSLGKMLSEQSSPPQPRSPASAFLL